MLAERSNGMRSTLKVKGKPRVVQKELQFPLTHNILRSGKKSLAIGLLVMYNP